MLLNQPGARPYGPWAPYDMGWGQGEARRACTGPQSNVGKLAGSSLSEAVTRGQALLEQQRKTRGERRGAVRGQKMTPLRSAISRGERWHHTPTHPQLAPPNRNVRSEPAMDLGFSALGRAIDLTAFG
jgi:hypothetical protein